MRSDATQQGLKREALRLKFADQLLDRSKKEMFVFLDGTVCTLTGF